MRKVTLALSDRCFPRYALRPRPPRRYDSLSGCIALLAVSFLLSAWGCSLPVSYDLAATHSLPPSSLPASSVRSRPVQDCGPRALLLVAQHIGIPNPLSLIDLTQLAGVQQDGASMAGMVAAAKAMKLKATGVQMDAEALANLPTPALAWVDGNHYVAVLNVTTDIIGVTSARIHDPNKADAETMTIPELLRRSGGVLLLLEKDDLKKGN